MRLITGPRRQTQGPRTSGNPPPAGVYHLVKGPMVRPDISNGTSRGTASCGPAPPCPATILRWSGQQDVTAAILRRYRTHPLR
jgi:hypothetical protein